MKFDRIIFMRESLDLSQREMATKLGTSKSNYARWETGDKIIPLIYLIKMCNLTKISLDYALAISDKRTEYHKLKVDLKIIGNRLKNIRKKNNLKQDDVAKMINTTQSVVSGFENGKNIIQTAFLYDICIKLNESADEICK